MIHLNKIVKIYIIFNNCSITHNLKTRKKNFKTVNLYYFKPQLALKMSKKKIVNRINCIGTLTLMLHVLVA